MCIPLNHIGGFWLTPFRHARGIYCHAMPRRNRWEASGEPQEAGQKALPLADWKKNRPDPMADQVCPGPNKAYPIGHQLYIVVFQIVLKKCWQITRQPEAIDLPLHLIQARGA